MASSKAFGVESCTVSCSLQIPARNKQALQPSSPLNVCSSTPPQLGQVCCDGACICLRPRFCLFCSPHGNDKIALESLLHIHGELANLQCFRSNSPLWRQK